MASDPKRKQPFTPGRSSHLRQDITADVNGDVCTRGEAEVQVPDSQVVIPETQLDSLGHPTCSEGIEDAGLTLDARQPEHPSRDDDAFLSRVQISRKAPAPDSNFPVNFLQRPAVHDDSSFSFVVPNRGTKPTQNRVTHIKSHNVVNAQRLSPPNISESGPGAVETAGYNGEHDPHHAEAIQLINALETEARNQFPDLAVLSTDEQGLPVVRARLVPPGIDEGGALHSASPTTLDQPRDAQSGSAPATDPSPAQDGTERVPQRRKIKKTRKVRRIRIRQPENPAIWSPRPHQTNGDDGADTEFGRNRVQDIEPTGSQDGNAIQEESMQGVARHTRDAQTYAIDGRQHSDVTGIVNGMHVSAGMDSAANEVMADRPYHYMSPQNHLGNDSQPLNERISEVNSPRLQAQSAVMVPPVIGFHDNSHIPTTDCDVNSRLTTTVHENRSQQDLQYDSQYYQQAQSGDKAYAEAVQGGDANAHRSLDFTSNRNASLFNTHTEHAQPGFVELPKDLETTFDQRDSGVSPEIQNRSRDDILHQKSTHGPPNRVRKLRTRKSPTVISNDLTSRLNQYVPSGQDSPENEAVLNALAICLRAGDTKARGIVETNNKAYEATIASLQETVMQQKQFIDSLQSENGDLKVRAEKISESTTHMQMYVSGMKDDFTLLKAQSEYRFQKYKTIVERKVKELEDEKTAMRHDFSETLEVVIRSQRNLKDIVNDCFTQLQITESRLEVTSKAAHYQSVLYEDAKKRRIELEEQILPTLQSIQEAVDHHHEDISHNLQVIQNTTSDKAGEKSQETQIQQCLDALRSLQAVPVLTTKEGGKAEAMLRYIHDSMGEKFGRLSQAVNKISDPAPNIQSFLADELASLRKDMVKYDEMVQRCEEAETIKSDLTQQLRAQKEQNVKLEEAYRSSQQEEADMKMELLALRKELSNVEAKACNGDSEPSDLEREIEFLRQQVKKLEGELHMRLTELGRAQNELEHQSSATTTMKETFEAQETILQRTITKHGHELDSRNQLIENLRQRTRDLTNDLDTAEVGIQEMKIQNEQYREVEVKLTHELKDAQSKADTSITLSSEVTRLNGLLEAKSEESRQLSTKLGSMSSEQTKLKEHLASSNEALHRTESECRELQRKQSSLNQGMFAHKQEVKRIQAQLEGKESTVSELREKIGEYVKEQENAAETLKQLQTCRNELKLLQTRNAEILRLHSSSDQRIRELEEKHITECCDLRDRITQLEGKLRETEKALEHKTRELEAHRQITEQKFQQLVGEAVQKRGMAIEQTQRIPSRDPRLRGRSSFPLEESSSGNNVPGNRIDSKNTHENPDSGVRNDGVPPSTKSTILRKKANRMNNTVLSIMEASKNRPADPNKVSGELVSPESKSHPNTSQMSQPLHIDISSSPLSDALSSDGLIDMAPLDQSTVTPKTKDVKSCSTTEEGNASRGVSRVNNSARSSRKATNVASPRSDDRPRSQANTASKIDPHAVTFYPAGRGRLPPGNVTSSMPSRSDDSKPKITQEPAYEDQLNDIDMLNELSWNAKDESTLRVTSSKRSVPDETIYKNLSVKRYLGSDQFVSLRSLDLSHDDQDSQPRSRSPVIVPTRRAHYYRGQQDSPFPVESQLEYQIKAGAAHAQNKPSNRSSRAKVKKREEDFDAVFDRELGSGEASRHAG